MALLHVYKIFCPHLVFVSGYPRRKVRYFINTQHVVAVLCAYFVAMLCMFRPKRRVCPGQSVHVYNDWQLNFVYCLQNYFSTVDRKWAEQVRVIQKKQRPISDELSLDSLSLTPVQYLIAHTQSATPSSIHFCVFAKNNSPHC